MKKANSGDKLWYYLSPENLISYFPAGFSGAGAGAGASAGAGVSGFGVSAGLQPTVNATNNINDKTKAITFFIKLSPPSK
jgi:hypothetical protein